MLSISNLVAAGLQLGLQVLVVRYLSVADYGAFVAAAVYSSLLEMILTARSGELALQMVGKHLVTGGRERAIAAARRLEREDLLVYGAAWAAFVPVAALLAQALDLRLAVLVGLALSLPAQSGYGVSKSLLIAGGKIQLQALMETCFWVVHVVLGVAGLFLWGVLGLVAAQVLANVIKTVLSRTLTYGILPRVLPATAAATAADSAVRAESWWSFGADSTLRNSLNFLSGQVDIVLLSALQGKEAVAIYKVAKSLASLPVRLTAPIWSAVRPRLIQAWHFGDRARVRRMLRLPAIAMCAGLGVAAVPAIWLAEPILIQLYGAAYRAAALPLLLLALGTLVFQSVTGWFSFWVVISESQRVGVWLYFLNFALLLAAGLVVGGRSAIAMAGCVAAVSLVLSALAWFVFERTTTRLRQQNVRL